MDSSSAGVQVVQLRTDTFVESTREPVPCTGSLLCPCEHCMVDRQAAVLRGIRKRTPQPWEPVAPRALRGAAA